MTADNHAALHAATQQRAQDTRRRAVDALRRLDDAGEPVTFSSVAQTAGISRSWLYRQTDLRASSDSQHRRREATLDEIQRLKTENHLLRQEIARRFGQQRADGHTPTPVEDMSTT
jgi:transposase-like protein